MRNGERGEWDMGGGERGMVADRMFSWFLDLGTCGNRYLWF